MHLADRRCRSLARLLGLAACLLPSAASQAGPGPAGCGTGSWIAGTVEICDGELVYRDYVYDDYGVQNFSNYTYTTGSLSYPTGNQYYPGANADTVNNYADIAAIRLRIVDGDLHVTFEMNSLFDASSTVVALAIDTDNSASTGGGRWPGNFVGNPEAVPFPQAYIQSAGWDVIYEFSNGDPETNTISGVISPAPSGGTHWRLYALAALASNRTVMNIAFRFNERGNRLAAEYPQNNWFEDEQATSLQFSGSINPFSYTVEVAKLTGGVTEPAVVGPGYYERVYTSDYTIAEGPGGGLVYDTGAEGVDYNGIAGRGISASDPAFSQVFHFVGRNQPYGIYVPPGPPPYGLQLVMHGYQANHTSLIKQPGMQQTVGDDLNRILVVPLGRGAGGFYSDISERDVLDVLADVRANYPVDPDRIFAGGYSMGGYGTLRMATLYPDLFAGYIDWVGYPGDACGQPDVQRCNAGEVGIAAEYLGNLREVDGALLYSGADELVNSAQGLWVRDLMAAHGYPHIFYYHPGGEHLTFAGADDWGKEAAYTASLVRRSQPPRITYRTEPWVDAPELGVVHDRAYWISKIRGVQTGERDYVDVDILTTGCGGDLRVFGEDPIGAGTDPVPWESQSFSVAGTLPIVPGPYLEATLANVASFTLHSGQNGACLDLAEDVDYSITTDGPVEIALSDGRSLSLASAGTHQGTLLPEPSGPLAFGASLLLLARLARRRRARQ